MKGITYCPLLFIQAYYFGVEFVNFLFFRMMERLREEEHGKQH